MDSSSGTHEASATASGTQAKVPTLESNAVDTASDDDDAGGVEFMRCLFDLNMPTANIDIPLRDEQTLRLVTAEDQELGALQSGIALWPAGQGLCDFVIEALERDTPNEIFQRRPRTVVELGAGCGLAGLGVALNLRKRLTDAGESAKHQLGVVITERDQKLLTMIEQSIELNDLDDCTTVCAHEWGCDGTPIDWALPDQNNLDTVLKGLLASDDRGSKQEGGGALDLILGADLIYSSKAVMDLFSTIRHLFDTHASEVCTFILGSSFRHEHSTELVAKFCEENRISRVVAKDELIDGGLLVEVFTRSPLVQS
jgi:predicted nicotinamide N-methyase